MGRLVIERKGLPLITLHPRLPYGVLDRPRITLVWYVYKDSTLVAVVERIPDEGFLAIWARVEKVIDR